MKETGATFTAGLSFFGNVASIIALSPDKKYYGVVVFTIFMIGSLVFLIVERKKRSKQLPSKQDFQHVATQVSIKAASPDDIPWIAQVEAELFSGRDAIPKDILEEWYEGNPMGFFVIKNQDGKNVGNITVLPIREDTLERFVNGTLDEQQIRRDSLYHPNETDSIKNIYIESAIIHLVGHCKAAAFYTSLSYFASLAEEVDFIKKIEKVYAIAASEHGEEIMKHLGFKLKQKGKERKDKHDLFVIEMSELLQYISKICDNQISKQELQNQIALWEQIGSLTK